MAFFAPTIGDFESCVNGKAAYLLTVSSLDNFSPEIPPKLSFKKKEHPSLEKRGEMMNCSCHFRRDRGPWK